MMETIRATRRISLTQLRMGISSDAVMPSTTPAWPNKPRLSCVGRPACLARAARRGPSESEGGARLVARKRRLRSQDCESRERSRPIGKFANRSPRSSAGSCRRFRDHAIVRRCGLKVMLTGGMLAGQFKKASEARSFVDSCLVLAERLDDRALLARCLAELAWAETSLGHSTRARVAYDRAHSIAVTSGSQLLLADVLRIAASTGVCGEEEVKGVQSECLALLRSLGDRISEIDVLNNSGYWAFLHGNFDRARSLLEEALALSQSVWSASNQATIKGNLALLDLFEGNLASAQESFLDALECSRNVGDTSQMREIIVGIAAICAETGQQEMALRLATAATSDPSGQASEAEPLIRKRHLEPLRTLLDAQQWNAAETAGHANGTRRGGQSNHRAHAPSRERPASQRAVDGAAPRASVAKRAESRVVATQSGQ